MELEKIKLLEDEIKEIEAEKDLLVIEKQSLLSDDRLQKARQLVEKYNGLDNFKKEFYDLFACFYDGVNNNNWDNDIDNYLNTIERIVLKSVYDLLKLSDKIND